MIIALDIETIPNPSTFAFLPEPEPNKTLKDPAKVAADIEAKRAKQRTDAALDPLTARIACFAAVGELDNGDEAVVSNTITAATDDAEREVVQHIMKILGTPDLRLTTWNGAGFDLPMIYKRAMCLGVNPKNFGAPPLSAWTKRYSSDLHCDLMAVWCGWQGYAKLDTVAGLVLGERKTEDIDVTTFAALIETEEGRAKIEGYCVQDTRLTFKLWKRMQGWLFA